MKHLKKINELYIDTYHRPRKEGAIDITKIMELGDNAERAFFSWLSKNHVDWYQNGTDLNQIILLNSLKFDIIKKAWEEIELIKE